MKVLLDERLPRRFARELTGHDVSTVPNMGWAGTTNGALLRLAETRFDAFIIADQNLQYQQRLQSALLGIIVLAATNTRLETLRPLAPSVLTALQTMRAGEVVRITA